jgi:hypothetical protein
MKRVVSSVMDTGEVMEGAVLGMFFPNGKMDSGKGGLPWHKMR